MKKLTKMDGKELEKMKTALRVSEMDDHELVKTMRDLLSSELSPAKLVLAMMIVLEPVETIELLEEFNKRRASAKSEA